MSTFTMECLYCGAPKPRLTVYRWRGFRSQALNDAFGMERSRKTKVGEVKVDCHNRACDKKYYYLGKPADPEVFVNQILYSDDVASGMVANGLTQDDLVNGITGVTVPTFYQRKAILRQEIHVVFDVKGKRYYLSCYPAGGMLRAIAMERMWRIQ